jgi:hypothetical protein
MPPNIYYNLAGNEKEVLHHRCVVVLFWNCRNSSEQNFKENNFNNIYASLVVGWCKVCRHSKYIVIAVRIMIRKPKYEGTINYL